MRHTCKFNGKGVCDWCGRIKGLTAKETAEYLEMLQKDDFYGSEAKFWALHQKTLS